MVCDLSEERLALVRRNIPSVAKFTTDAHACITDPAADAVVIATPVHTHFQLAREALEAGKHVFVEKPLCQSAQEAEVLIGLAEERRRHLCVGHVFLFNNGIRAVRNLIRSGELGRIHYLSSTRVNLGPFRRDVNALWDLASHDISIFNYWLDGEPIAVTAHGGSYLNPEVEDVVMATFTYPHRVLASVHASWLHPRKVREIVVVGERKMAVWDDMNLSEPVRVYDKSVNVERDPLYSDSFGSFRMQIRNGDVLIPYVAGPEPLAAECEHFLNCVAGKARPINSGEVGLSVIRALEAADRSMRSKAALTPICIEGDGHRAYHDVELGLPAIPVASRPR